MWPALHQSVLDKDIKALARSISLIENEYGGYEQFLATLPQTATSKIIGITGPPGAGKSTLVDGLIKELIKDNKRVAVLCVDPSSPFNLGAVLGDRIRMSEWYTNPQVYIRSLATRGAMGGLHPKIIEITEVLKAAAFDFIIIETVGVGQSEIEIAGLADVTVVVLVPEGGDEIQTMKAGLMEIADIFVVNKSDRPGADLFVKSLRLMLAPSFSNHQKMIPIIKTVALQKEGIEELAQKIQSSVENDSSEKKYWLLAERAWYLIQASRMKDLDKDSIKNEIEKEVKNGSFNLYKLVTSYLSQER
ncbi:MAG: methylmalonyl Co-A mutase-associated GTPase MeaB [Chitinophagaceae bacterium]